MVWTHYPQDGIQEFSSLGRCRFSRSNLVLHRVARISIKTSISGTEQSGTVIRTDVEVATQAEGDAIEFVGMVNGSLMSYGSDLNDTIPFQKIKS